MGIRRDDTTPLLFSPTLKDCEAVVGASSGAKPQTWQRSEGKTGFVWGQNSQFVGYFLKLFFLKKISGVFFFFICSCIFWGGSKRLLIAIDGAFHGFLLFFDKMISMVLFFKGFLLNGISGMIFLNAMVLGWPGPFPLPPTSLNFCKPRKRRSFGRFAVCFGVTK